MNCPQCGLYLPDANVAQCPRCGWTRAASPGAITPTPAPDYNPWASPGAAPAPTPPAQYPQPPSTTAPGWPSYAPNTTPSPMYPSAQPPAPEQASPYGPGGQPGMPSYGQSAPPSVPMYGQYGQYGQPGQYGQYAPPSMPMYGQAAPPSMGQLPAWGAPPPPAPKKSHTGLIVSLVVVLVLILGAGGGFLALHASQQPGGTGGNATATVPVATATATPSNIVFQDSFTDSSSGWANDSHCTYKSDGYHIKDGFICSSPAGSFTNAAVSVTVKQISGSNLEPYGMSVRIGDQFQYHYEFDIDSNGKWVVFKCGNGNCSRLHDYTANSAIHTGLNSTNALSVTMQDSQFVFTVNGTQVGQLSDSAYASGQVGLDAGSGIEVVFTNFAIANA